MDMDMDMEHVCLFPAIRHLSTLAVSALSNLGHLSALVLRGAHHSSTGSRPSGHVG